MTPVGRCAIVALLGLGGCRDAAAPVAPGRAAPQPLPVLSERDQALLASLSDDPGDVFDSRVRIWRVGSIRLTQTGTPLGPDQPLTLQEPLTTVVVERAGPRILLPLDQLEWHPPAPEPVRRADVSQASSPESLWRAVRLTARVAAGDLVAVLARDLAPTPWLSLSAGTPLTPLARDGERLRVGWDDSHCGFGLTLAIDPADFGPLYRVPAPEPEPPAKALRLAPGASVFDSPDSGEPLLHLDAASTIDPDGPGWTALQITRTGPSKRGRTPIVMQCHGVTVRGWVENRAVEESPGRYAFVDEADTPAISTCNGTTGSPVSVPIGTVLHAKDPTTHEHEVIGVVVEAIEMTASIQGNWLETCIPSPWGDLVVRMRATR